MTPTDPVGNYGIKLVFSDGHDTGIYDWEYPYRLGVDQARLWQTYLERLEAAGHQRQG
ncbi:Protein of unknown function [Ectothiorhodospira magna]|uniref:Gamma-butyrobetaine hydroxylase-like N-terminal domain-containing protein n=1 Tax=Ectothiorhodospira magna TaxID=867345 RepID=A0A1H9D8F8_9GAMM|nr:Protein of unknown function [Ectothiorhodospira magna]